MARKPFVHGAMAVLALLVTLAPATAAAQEYTWTADRPDGVAPAGIFAERVLPAGTFEVEPTFRSFDFLSTRVGSEFIGFDELLRYYELAPYAMSTNEFGVNLGFGVSDELTIVGRVGYATNSRELIDENDQLFVLENDGITDLEVHALYAVYEAGAWRAHLQGGVSIPTGSVDSEDDEADFRSGPLPYDMQTGSGVLGFIPGATVQTMNEHGSVGLQVLGRLWVGENDRGWRPGNGIEANGWAAYRVNRFFSVSSGVRASAWNAIEGFDDELDPDRDPGENPTFFAGERVDIPFGVNLRVPEGVLEGHRLGVEFLWNVHEELDGPWLAADDGFVLSWTLAF